MDFRNPNPETKRLLKGLIAKKLRILAEYFLVMAAFKGLPIRIFSLDTFNNNDISGNFITRLDKVYLMNKFVSKEDIIRTFNNVYANIEYKYENNNFVLLSMTGDGITFTFKLPNIDIIYITKIIADRESVTGDFRFRAEDNRNITDYSEHIKNIQQLEKHISNFVFKSETNRLDENIQHYSRVLGNPEFLPIIDTGLTGGRRKKASRNKHQGSRKGSRNQSKKASRKQPKKASRK